MYMALTQEAYETFNSTRCIRNATYSGSQHSEHLDFNSTRCIRNKGAQSKKEVEDRNFNSTRCIRNIRLSWTLRGGSLNFNSTRCIRNSPYLNHQQRQEDISTPHGALGTNGDWKNCIVDIFDFNSTRCIRNTLQTGKPCPYSCYFQLHTVH